MIPASLSRDISAFLYAEFNESFNFPSLPRNLQVSVMEKFSYEKFALFGRSSRLTWRIAEENRNMRFQAKFGQIVYKNGEITVVDMDEEPQIVPFHAQVSITASFLRIEEDLTEEVLDILTERVNTASFVDCTTISAPLKRVKDFVREAQVHAMTVHLQEGQSDFHFDHIGLKGITVYNASSLPTELILSLTTPSIQIMGARLTAMDIALLIKQWTECDRKYDKRFHLTEALSSIDRMKSALEQSNIAYKTLSTGREATLNEFRIGFRKEMPQDPVLLLEISGLTLKHVTLRAPLRIDEYEIWAAMDVCNMCYKSTKEDNTRCRFHG